MARRRPVPYLGKSMSSRRREATASSKARAARISAALEGLLEDLPEPQAEGTGDPYRPVAAPQRSTRGDLDGLSCPACRGSMSIEWEQGVEIHRCHQCHGLWLDPGEIDELVDEPSGPPPPLAELRTQMQTVAPAPSEVRYRKCPRCSDVMNRRNYGSHSGVIVDECPRHGIFLDPGEFEAIETFVRLGGLALQRRSEKERLGAAARRLEAERVAASARANHVVTGRRGRWWHLFDLLSGW